MYCPPPLFLFLFFFRVKTTFTSEYAGYSDPCNPNLPCTPNKSLQCGPLGKCECVQDQIHVVTYEGCLPEPRSENRWQCIRDAQCHLSALGHLSTCDQGRCTCLQETDEGHVIRDVVLHENFCYQVNNWGELCGHDAGCDAARHFKCVFGPERGRCDCPQGTHWAYFNRSTDMKECWSVHDPFPCESFEECEEVIGGLASCDARAGSCKCYDTSGGGQATGFYLGKCHYIRKVQDPCTADGECRVEGSSEVICDQVTHTCQLKQSLSSAIWISGGNFQILILIFAVHVF